MKIHLRNRTARVEDYSNRPHPQRAIEEGIFATCGIITERVTDELSEVTCNVCLKVNRDGNEF